MVWLYHSCLPITDLLKDFWADSSCYEHLYRFLCEHKVLFFWDKFPDNAIAVSYDICTFILKKKKSVFQSFWALTFPSAMYEWSSFSTSLAAFGVTLFLIYFSPSDVKWHLTVILICVSLRVNDVEHIFMCLFAICISSSVKRFCLSSVHFIMFACFFYCGIFESSLYSFGTNPLSDMWFLNIFSPFAICLFILLSFYDKKFLILMFPVYRFYPLWIISVHSGYCNKTPQTGWLINNRNLFHSSGGGKVQNQGTSMAALW